MKSRADNSLPFDPAAIAPLLLAWYGREGRELPWRGTRDPYRIWLAEIMLQQTTVATAGDYYRRFLGSFPTVERLAAAPLERVIDLWAGLGYYARARNLHATARLVTEEYGGVFPTAVEQLQQLPGVGRSTAGAIAALAFEQRAPILDGNVRRVLSRLFALQQPPRSTAAEKQLWYWAELLTPLEQVHDYTQAIMDLGATVCVPRQPDCHACPLNELCLAHRLGLADQLPLKVPAKKIPTRRAAVLLLENKGRYFARRRPASGFLGGLWEFPCVDLENGESVEGKMHLLMSEFAVSGDIVALGSISHVYSHFRLELQLFMLSIRDLPRIAEGESGWFSARQLMELALHGAHKKALGLVPSSGV